MSKTRSNEKGAIVGLCVVTLCVLIGSQATIANQEDMKAWRRIIYYDYIDENGVLKGGKIEVETGNVEDRDRLLLDYWNVETIIDNGPTDNRVDLVFLGDGYQESELGDYATNVSDAVGGFFDELPLDEYDSYFNVYRVDVISTDSGVDHDPKDGGYPNWKDTALDMGFDISNPYLLTIDDDKADAAASEAPDSDHVFALANSQSPAGTGYYYEHLALASGDVGNTDDICLHELGHSFGDLDDEYDYYHYNYYGPEPDYANVSIYNAQLLEIYQTKWYRWLDEENVGAFHGAMREYFFGIYRPTECSKMNDVSYSFEQVNTEQLVFAIYEVVSPVDDATPLGTYAQNTVFFVEPMQPATHDLDIQWYLDGNPIDGATGTSLDASTLGLSPGTYTLSVSVVDNTELVRDEDMREDYMSDSREWTLEVECFPDSHPDYDEWVYVGKPDCWCYPRQCHGDADGQYEGKDKYWVCTNDLDILLAAWNKPLGELSGDEICADFDHAAQGKQSYRVSTNDLDILVTNWQIPDGPDPDCFDGYSEGLKGGTISPVKHYSLEEIIEWLEEIWLDPEIHEVIDEDRWIKFVESLMEVYKSE